MICSSVILCLSTGLAKISDQNYVHVCPIFPAFLAILKVWLFFENGGQTVHQSSQA